MRYKQTALGVAWAVFQPLMAMVIFTVFFNKLAGIQSDNIPYPVFVYVGLLFWQFFSGALTDISNCLVNNQAVITKVYFPRLLLPIAATATKFIDFLIGTVYFRNPNKMNPYVNQGIQGHLSIKLFDKSIEAIFLKNGAKKTWKTIKAATG